MTQDVECDLASRACVPCAGGVPPLDAGDSARLLKELDGWDLVDHHHLSKVFAFPDFATALDFVNRVGEVAERNAHHPDVYLSWGKVRIEIHTHKINGLTESDFILAAKCDVALGARSSSTNA